MAIHISRQEINSMTEVDYEAIRNDLNSGDILFAAGDYLISKAIQNATSSPWSHIGIIVKFESINRVFSLESVEDMGVRLVPLSKYLRDYENNKPYKGALVLARLQNSNSLNQDAMLQFGFNEITKPYDKDEIAKIIARIALGIGRRNRDREYICSELVYECFSRAGKEFEFNRKDFISPEDIWIDSDISLMHRIL